MRESITHTFVYNMIILFIVIVFGILAAAVSYYKAFKVNNRIISSLEKYEGYNTLAQEEIGNTLETIGYTVDQNSTCPTRGDVAAMSNGALPYPICVYYYPDDTSTDEDNGTYYNYSVVSYIYVDIPIIDRFRIPVHTKAERIYRFTGTDGGRS